MPRCRYVGIRTARPVGFTAQVAGTGFAEKKRPVWHARVWTDSKRQKKTDANVLGFAVVRKLWEIQAV